MAFGLHRAVPAARGSGAEIDGWMMQPEDGSFLTREMKRRVAAHKGPIFLIAEAGRIGRASAAVLDYGLAIDWLKCRMFDTNLTGAYEWCPLGPILTMTDIAVLIPCYNESADHRAPRWPISARRYPPPRSMSTTTIRRTRPQRWRAAGAIVRARPCRAKAMSCAACSPCRSGCVCAGRRRRHLRGRRRARDDRHADRRKVSNLSGKREATGTPPIAEAMCWASGCSPASPRCVPRQAGRHAERLSRDVAPLCEILSLHRARLRHRDRTHRACRAHAGADGRSALPLQGTPGRVRQQAQHLSRRHPYPVHHRVVLREERPLFFYAPSSLSLRCSRSPSAFPS